jgi:hypothetical protein
MKNHTRKRFRIYLFSAVLMMMALFAGITIADEGMWTFDNLPLKVLKEKYGFIPTQEWLDHVRLSSVRLGGGSGSFVSPNGLVMTNHHVAVGQLQKISTPDTDYVTLGFYAQTLDDEIPCPDLEVVILVGMENVTDQVLSSVKKKMSPEEALKARQAMIAKIEKKSLDKTGLKSTVISLYHGGEYWLYKYRKFTDVRMVFAPERQAAYFGGDFDNFTYPRYDLDVAFFRVYEDGKPLKNEHYLTWNATGAVKDELVFVSGNPGSTDRLYTYSQLEFQRDHQYPVILDYIQKRIDQLREYATQGQEQERRALISLFGLENGKKALSGEYKGLLDEELMAQHLKEELIFKKEILSTPEWKEAFGDAWDTISKVIELQTQHYNELFHHQIRGSRLAGIAQSLVFYAIETEKPDGERLNGYHDSDLPGFKFRLLSPAPVYKDMELSSLKGSLEMSLSSLGPDDEFVKAVLQGRTPEQTARELIEGTRLEEVSVRKDLMEGGRKAIEKSDDPLIVLMRKMEPMFREQTEWIRKNIGSVLTPASEKIAKARFAVYGKDVYPDATFTLRLSFGTVKGYPMNGTKAPYKTTLYGLYDRAISFDQETDFYLPERFWKKQDRLDLSTPVNFVSSCDIIGGNSGSPVINTKGEVIGLVFDGNIESLVGRFIFDEETNRTVAVHTAYITEALKHIYEAESLIQEIMGR